MTNTKEVLFYLMFGFLGMSVLSNNLERHEESEITCAVSTFNPTCRRPDEVVVITRAAYGVTVNHTCGYQSPRCVVDVKELLHHRCSGRFDCKVFMPDRAMEAMSVCATNLKVYLNTTYKCVKVERETCGVCRSPNAHGIAKLTSQEGYISSSVTAYTYPRCGTTHCPWKIEVKPGQKINLTLIDFAYGKRDMSYHLPDSCLRYAVIKEDSAPRVTPICAGVKHHWVVYTSVSNSLDISMVSPDIYQNKSFLIHYEALGCPDMTPPPNTRLQRSDSTLDIHCDTKQEKWTLTCKDHEWKGTYGQCPPVGTPSPIVQNHIIDIPIGVLVAIVIGIALVIGSLILTIGIVCLKRHHARSFYGPYFRPRHDYDYPLEMLGTAPGELYVAPKPSETVHEPSKYQPVMLDRIQQQQRNWYQRKQDVQNRPLPSLPNIAEASGSASTASHSDDDPQTLQTAADVHFSNNNQERRYLTNPRPSSARAHTGAAVGRKGKDPQYFMLEHNRLQQQQRAAAAAAAAEAAHADTRTESKSDDPAFHRIRAMRLAAQQKQQQQKQQEAIKLPLGGASVNNNNPSGSVSGGAGNVSKPEIAPKPNLKLNLGAATPSTGNTGPGVPSSGRTPGSTAGGKSPEEENAENVDKEAGLNSSCHEIPLRPSRILAHNVNNIRTENTTGKTSWP